MGIKKDREEQFIKEALEREAEAILQENAEEGEADPLPEDVKERIRKKIQNDIEQYEKEHGNTGLSADESHARKPEREERRGKKSWKLYLILAAALLMALGASMTTMGGPERVVQLVKSIVGEREVTRINSGEDTLIIESGDAEEAYEVLSDELGVEPVKIATGSLNGLRFEEMEFDTNTQTAELIYTYKGENVIYFINAAYVTSSWGVDAEDKVTAQYELERRGCVIGITEYETPESKTRRYEAEFRYNKIEYSLIGTMEKEEFETILNNFHFIS